MTLVAQRKEHPVPNRKVAGSNPAEGTNLGSSSEVEHPPVKRTVAGSNPAFSANPSKGER